MGSCSSAKTDVDGVAFQKPLNRKCDPELAILLTKMLGLGYFAFTGLGG